MNILTEDERAALLRTLTDAPDEILIDAVRQRKDWMKNIRSTFDEVRGFVGMKEIKVSPPPPVAATTKAGLTPPVEAAPKDRPNVNPGRSSITKIGQKTKDLLIDRIKVAGSAPLTQLGIKYEEHLKLLHNRGEVKYDGKEYYI